MQESISGIEDTMEEIDTQEKENIKSKNVPNRKHPENLGHNEETKFKNNSNRRIPAQRLRKHSHQNYRRKLSSAEKNMPIKIQETF